MTILGNRIKSQREYLGLTREELAKKIGVSYSAIAMYERGEREPNSTIIIKMCEVFNCSMDYLMGLSLYKYPQKALQKRLRRLRVNEEELKFLKDLFVDKAPIDISNYIQNLSDKRKIEIIDSVLQIALEVDIIDTEQNNSELNEKIKNNIDNIKGLINNIDITKIIPVTSSDFEHSYISVISHISQDCHQRIGFHEKGCIQINPTFFNVSYPEDLFLLHVQDDSINIKVKKDDYAIITRQNYAENGDIIVFITNKYNNAILRKYIKVNNSLIALESQSDNQSYETLYIGNDTEIRILGKLIGYLGFTSQHQKDLFSTNIESVFKPLFNNLKNKKRKE